MAIEYAADVWKRELAALELREERSVRIAKVSRSALNGDLELELNTGERKTLDGFDMRISGPQPGDCWADWRPYEYKKAGA